MTRRTLLFLAVALASLTPARLVGAQTPPGPRTNPPTAQPPLSRPDADRVAQALQRRYDTIRDFSADFVHTYRGGILRTPVSERGTLAVKKPGMMRWVYTSPEKKTFVSDGRKMYAYIPADRQVIVSTLPSGDEAPAPVLFLAGQGHITRDFTVTWADGEPAPAYALRLVPKKPDADYAALIVRLDPGTLQIRELTTIDGQGGRSTFVLTKLQENTGLPDTQFAFRIPPNVDVLTDDRSAR